MTIVRGSLASRIVRLVWIEAGRRADAVAVETATHQKVGGLAPLYGIAGAGVAEAAADKVAGVLGPVALDAGSGGVVSFALESMHAQFRADVQWAVSAAGTAAHQRLAKARVVLPAGVDQFCHRGLRLVRLHTACGQLAGELPARMLPPGQQAKRPLGRGELRTLA